jgi:hypothetical protein
MFLLQINKLPTEISNILVKSRNVDENRKPNILVHPFTGMYCKLEYLVSGTNQSGESFMINYNVPEYIIDEPL